MFFSSFSTAVTVSVYYQVIYDENLVHLHLRELISTVGIVRFIK